MAELLVSRLKLMSEFKGSFRLNSAPALLFVGADFEHKPGARASPRIPPPPGTLSPGTSRASLAPPSHASDMRLPHAQLNAPLQLPPALCLRPAHPPARPATSRALSPRPPSAAADFALLRNLLHDHFVGAEPPSAVPARLPAERVLVFTAHGDGLVSMRHYAVTVGVANADTLVMAPAAAAKLLGLGEGEGGADGGGSRHVRLTEIGPSCELKLARSRFADDELRKSALRRPKTSAKVPARVKNVSHTELLGKRGRLRIERQDLHQAALKKSKALRKASKPAAAVAKPAAAE